ncbi:MAG: Major facilitator superfamily protein [Acidobacteria bacterium]|jgi:MFS family permease|nr:Major facilitator superfamily protein [Acidobacteriota bacterium]
MNQTASRNRGFFYGWVIVAVSTLALAVSNGLTTLGFPIFHFWIREDFVARGVVDAANAQSFIANGATLTFLVAGFFSPVAGFLIQKYSLRSLMIAGCGILGLGLILHSQATTPAAVYLARILMGASLGFVGVLANTVLVSNWFRRLRGTAIGIILMGTSFGGMLVPLISTPLITGYGWRTAMLFVSLIVWLILLPAIVFFVKNKPGDIGLLPDGDDRHDESRIANRESINAGDAVHTSIKKDENSNTKEPAAETGFTLAEALKTPLFWIFALCAALIFYPIFVTSQQFILYLQSPKIGLSPASAGFAQSLLFTVSVGGKFLFGFLSDRFSPTRVMLLCSAVMTAASFVLLSLNADNALYFLIPFGLGYGGTFVLLQRLVADYFGTREYGKILGVITLIETVGAAIGGVITGKLADAAGGDYTLAFYGVIVTTTGALLLVILLNFMFKPETSKNA